MLQLFDNFIKLISIYVINQCFLCLVNLFVWYDIIWYDWKVVWIDLYKLIYWHMVWDYLKERMKITY